MSDDRAYFERRERVHRVLDIYGPMRAVDVADRLGWGLREVSAKLQGLRRDGRVDRDEERSDHRMWWAT